MRAASAHARAVMNLTASTSGFEAWGWHGRTLSQPVITSGGPAWLRVASAPAGKAATTFWDGPIEAEKAVPATVPRPRLRSWHDWSGQRWQYRAELYDHARHQPVAATPVLTSDPDLTPRWWAAARAALADIAAIPTSRLSVQPAYLRQAMPTFLGTPIATAAPCPWITAHGDFHFANITSPELRILDFEGWGLAPAGYDAATLHSHSLRVPATAARIRAEFAGILATPAGRFAELAAITELLDAASRGEHAQLVEALRHRASLLLGRDVPSPIRAA